MGRKRTSTKKGGFTRCLQLFTPAQVSFLGEFARRESATRGTFVSRNQLVRELVQRELRTQTLLKKKSASMAGSVVAGDIDIGH